MYTHAHTHTQKQKFFFFKVRSLATEVCISHAIPSPFFYYDHFASAVSCFINRSSSESHKKVKMHCFHYYLQCHLFYLRKCAQSVALNYITGTGLWSSGHIFTFPSHPFVRREITLSGLARQTVSICTSRRSALPNNNLASGTSEPFLFPSQAIASRLHLLHLGLTNSVMS